MTLRRTLAIARKQFLTLRHDKRTLALMLVAPVMAMLIFGFAFGSSAKHVPVVVVNEDRGATAGKIVDALDHDVLAIATSSDLAGAKAAVDRGDKVAVLYFAPGFTADASPQTHLQMVPGKAPAVQVLPPKGAHAQLYVDTTNQELAGVVMAQLPAAAGKLAAAAGQKSPINFDNQYAFTRAKNATTTDSLVPGIIAFAITVFTTLLTLLAFVGERTSGTLDRLRVTPATEAEIVLGYELAFGVIAAVQGGLLLTVALLVYHVLIVGPLAVAALVVVLTAIDAQAIGIVVSAAARRESQAVQFIPFIIFPTFLLSGIFVALSSLPDWLRPFSYLLPPTWAIQALRDVLLRGWGLDHVWPQILVLLGFAIIFTTGAIVGLKRSRA